jgi:hypothetical protein
MRFTPVRLHPRRHRPPRRGRFVDAPGDTVVAMEKQPVRWTEARAATTLFACFFGRMTARAAAKKVAAALRAQAPEIRWRSCVQGRRTYWVEVPHRWILRFRDGADGPHAQIVVYRQPGDDPPPWPLRDSSDVAELVRMLIVDARDTEQQLTVYRLRARAVYEILRDFVDHSGTAFHAGTRLTFRERHFRPHDYGHILVFDEGFVYATRTSDLIERFDRYLAVAKQQRTP